MKQIPRLLIGVAGVTVFIWAARRGTPEAPDATGATDLIGGLIETAPPGLRQAGAGLGLLLLGSWLVGRLFKAVHLPKVSGFLIFGMLVGPGLLALVSKEQLQYLRLVNDLAISLIALTAGGEIRLDFVRKSLRVISLVASIQTMLILVGVTAAAALVAERYGFAASGGLQPTLLIALAIATIATASSPAVLVAIIGESDAKGPMTRTALSTVVVKDLILVALFAVVIALATGLIPADPPAGPAAISGATAPDPAALSAPAESNTDAAERPPGVTPVVQGLIVHLGGSLAAGVGIGWLLAWYMRRLSAHLPVFVVMACFGIALLSEMLELEALLVALVAGLMMRNVWPERAGPLFEVIEDLSLPVYCVFFAVAGAKLDITLLATLWPAALLISATRAAMIWCGTAAGVRLASFRGPASRWLWTAFVPQAGVSVALASILQRSFEARAFADNLYNLVLATIAIHELLGPVLLKIGFWRAGESGGGQPAAAPSAPARSRNDAQDASGGSRT